MVLHAALLVAAATASCRNPYQDATVLQPAPPVYPESARALGLGAAKVKVTVTVSPIGTAIAARILQSSGNMALDQAALNAARQSRYAPKLVNCQPVVSDYLFSLTFDPKTNPGSGAIPLPVPPPQIPPTPSPCQTDAVAASQRFEILQRRRDYNAALLAAEQVARVQSACGEELKRSEQGHTMEMLGATSLSAAADLAYRFGRYQQACSFATQSTSLYQSLLASESADSGSSRYFVPNGSANIEANNDLLARISRQELCNRAASASGIPNLVRGQMPMGSTVRVVSISGNYAIAAAYGPGGYAARSYLLAKRNGWKILTSEGGAFDLATLHRNGVPAGIAQSLTLTSCM